MSHTIIGFFDDVTKVQTALQRLTYIAIPSNNIDVSSVERCASVVSSTKGQCKTNKQSEGGNDVSHFFDSLFKEDDKLDRYSRVTMRSNVIVKVQAQSYREAEEAADILDECGALDIDERGLQ